MAENNYLLFCFNDWDADGGINDLLGSFTAENDAAASKKADAIVIDADNDKDNYQLVCIANGACRPVEYDPPLVQSCERRNPACTELRLIPIYKQIEETGTY